MTSAKDNPHVLVVDDEPVVRQTLSMALETDGWIVDAVASAEEALPRLAERSYAVMLVDKNLPGETGLAFARRVRDRDAAVGFLLITGFSSVESALDGLHIGIDGYLEKPFDDIFAVVRQVGETADRAAERRRAGRMAGAVGHFARARAALEAAAVGLDAAKLIWLIISASDEDAALVGAALAEEGDRHERAASAAAGLARLGAGGVDVAVVDASLGSGDLVDWVAAVRAAAPETTCVLLAGRPSMRVVTRLIRLEVAAVLERPCDPMQLRQRLARVRERTRQRRRAGGRDG
jgi:DNA-binding response OmpR family regulator